MTGYVPMHKNQSWQRGYVQVYTGNGKGKTTAAFGLALRAAGAGLPVFIAQFVKRGDYSEIHAFERFGDLITVRQYGRDNFIRREPTEEDIQAARNGLEEVRGILDSGRFRVVILDEANIATYFKLISVDDLLALIGSKPAEVELVITGRNADARVIQRADLVTEMQEVKHYYASGVQARKGIES
jgi:cob(I)alamin adenosyltransferase